MENSSSKPVQHLCEARSQSGRKKATSRTPDGKMPGESKSSPREIQNYLGRISGPLLDRIDLHIEVPQKTLIAASRLRTMRKLGLHPTTSQAPSHGAGSPVMARRRRIPINLRCERLFRSHYPDRSLFGHGYHCPGSGIRLKVLVAFHFLNARNAAAKAEDLKRAFPSLPYVIHHSIC